MTSKITKNDQTKECKIVGTLHKQTEASSQVFVRLVPPRLGTRQPGSFVCVVDISGSMGSNTESPNPDETPFTRMNLVVHSLRALAQTFIEEDLVSIITFGTNTTILLDNQKMTAANLKKLEQILDELEATGCTDMMGGLDKGIELSRKAQKIDNRPTFVIMLTDGDASTTPSFPNSPFANYTRQLISQNHFTASIHTFGYGYELDSRALYDISQVGGGIFSFIPDSTMVGTAMVNVFSASGATIFSKTRVRVKSSTPIIDVEGYDISSDRSDLKIVDIDVGSLQYGQTRDLLVNIKTPADNSTPVVHLEAFFEASANKAQDVFCVDKYESENGKTENDVERAVQQARYSLINALKKVIKTINMDTYYSNRYKAKTFVNEKSLAAAKKELDSAFEYIKKLNTDSAAAGDERLESILSDIYNDESENVGQIGKAISKDDWFIKWGNSYLISLLTALQQQICHNFKDKSVQKFGGPLFEKLQEKAQTAFCTLPPPKSTGYVYSTSNQTYTAPTNMSNYYYAHGGCIHGQCLVRVAPSTPNAISSPEGFIKRVDNIRKNDKILLPDGSTADVLCVVETILPEGSYLTKIGDLMLTPFHPIFTLNANGVKEWQFPSYVSHSQTIPFHGTVYDFVLERGHSVTVNGVECITLGHGRNDNSVLSHSYYGTQKVIDDLQRVAGWNDGRVVIQKLNRDPTTKLVTGIEAHNLTSLSA